MPRPFYKSLLAVARPCRRLRGVLAMLAMVLSIRSLAGQETLDQAWELAVSADHRLKSANRSVQAAQETLSAAKSARMPGVSTENGYTALSNPLVTKLSLPGLQAVLPIPLPSQLPFSQDRFFVSATMFTVPVYTSGKLRHTIEAAKEGADASAAEKDRTALDLKMNVAEAFIGVLRILRLNEVASQSVLTLEGHARDAANAYELGVVGKNDSLAARVALAESRQRLLQTSNALELAKSAYNRLLGRDFQYPVNLADPVEPVPGGDEAALRIQARQLRPELRGLQHQTEALRHQASVERAGSLPQVAFMGGHTYIQNKYIGYPNIWSATIGMKWNIFDSGMARHKARALRERAESVSEMRSDAETLISLQVKQALLDFQEARERITVAREAVAQSEENLKVAKDRYGAGVGTNTEVLDGEALRARSSANLTNATYDLALASLRLRRAIGTL